MLRRLQVIRLFEIRILQKEATHFRHKEHDPTKYKQKYADRLQVVYRVIGMECYAVQRYAIFIFVLLDIDAIGVV